MDDDLRIALWNVLFKRFLRDFDEVSYFDHHDYIQQAFAENLLLVYFKKPIDTMPMVKREVFDFIKARFFSNKWHEVFDLIEAIIVIYPNENVAEDFIIDCNQMLEMELSAYRIIDNRFVEITSDEEIKAIESAMTQSPDPVRTHLRRALELFADRKNPDYRNSIKESISAVESICKLIAGSPKATLGEALKALENGNKVQLHGALKSSFVSLYGFTSQSDGIRHAMLVEPDLYAEDAQYFLITCSGFINYLMIKATKAGIRL